MSPRKGVPRPSAKAPQGTGERARKAGQPFIILTGLSGSGKSQAIRALEDLGYFCVDNLPTTLIPTLAKLSLRAGGDIEKVAIVVDVREGNFLSAFPKVFRRLRKMPRLNPVLIFLEADTPALVRRFSETRRPHPLAPGRSVREGIRDERSRMNAIREAADEIIDTSDMTVHELRQFFTGLSRDRARAPLVITLLSFGYKHGVPVDADLVFDVRCLPNPHFVPTLRRRTGRDRAVVDFMERDASTREFMDRLADYLKYVVPHYVAEGKSYLTIAIGCTGGRHRSVMIGERLRKAVATVTGVRVRVRHRDIQHP
ncbi:MAG TPA: RNase adapter RapZ [Vicinamibacterales bacterium]